MRVAAVQAHFPVGEVDHNIDVMKRLGGQAADAGVDVVVFPELCVSGYSTNVDSPGFGDGDGIGAVASVARDAGCAVVGGFPEWDGGDVYNSVALVDSDGATIAVRRKRLLWVPERVGYTPATAATTVAELRAVSVGLLICYEVEFPEYARATRQAGADVMLVPTATGDVGSQGRFSEMVVSTRASENNAYVVYANHVGPMENGQPFMGRSIIAGPSATVLASATPDQEQVILADIDIDGLAAQRTRLPYVEDIGIWPAT